MEIRESDSGDTEQIRNVVESSMTASFRLSPQQIDGLVENVFGDDQLRALFDDPDTVFLVSTVDAEAGSDIVAGFFWGSVDDGRGNVLWLFVDPEHRGQGIGTRLFETGVENLREAGGDELRAFALQAGMDGHQFFEQFGYEQTDERNVDIGDQTFAQYVYTASGDSGPTSGDTGSSGAP
jgi:GNAT superfamily N-acetyltransferase